MHSVSFGPVCLLCFQFLNMVSCDTYLSNFKFERIVVGDDSLMKDYVTLANDPKGDLPESFTICSSVFFKYWSTGISIIEMLKEDGSHWFHMNLRTAQRKYDSINSMTEWFSLYYENPATGSIDREDFTDMIPIAIEQVLPKGNTILRRRRERLWINRYESIEFGANTKF